MICLMTCLLLVIGVSNELHCLMIIAEVYNPVKPLYNFINAQKPPASTITLASNSTDQTLSLSSYPPTLVRDVVDCCYQMRFPVTSSRSQLRRCATFPPTSSSRARPRLCQYRTMALVDPPNLTVRLHKRSDAAVPANTQRILDRPRLDHGRQR